MDVKVDATMRWDGVAAVERRRARRWIAVAGVVVPVLAVVAAAMWFVRAFVVPPTITIPGPMSLASAPPDMPAQVPVTDGRAPATEPASEPAPAAVPEHAAPAMSAPLPMVQSLALAPPVLTFSPPPAAAPAPQAEQIEAGAPISGPIPLPPRPPRASVARAADPVPLPPMRPAQ